MTIAPGDEPAAVVARWQAALNRRDPDEVLSLSSDEIEIVGPRGVAKGLDVLRVWLESTHVQLLPIRTYVRGFHVVVSQHGVWSDPLSGEIIGRTDVASFFEVAKRQVTRYARFDTLAAALIAGEMSEGDEIDNQVPAS